MTGTQQERATITEIDPTASEAWDAFLSKSPQATIFHSSSWMQALTRTYGLSFRATVLEEDGEIVGGIPWVRYQGIVGNRKVSLPFSDFCEVLARDAREAQLLVERTLADGLPWKLCASSSQVRSLQVHSEQLGDYKRQGIDLRPEEDALWDALASVARRNIRKAERSGVELRMAESVEDLHAWFMLHLKVRKYRYRLLAQPFSFFKELWDRYVVGRDGFLVLAIQDGKIIGGDFVLTHGTQAYYKFNASDPDYLWARPNDILMWRAMMEAKRLGYERLDLGRSPVSTTGLMTFKRHFGTIDEDISVVEFNQSAGEPDSVAQEAKVLLQRMTELFVDDSAPDSLTARAGEILYPYFA